MRYSTAYPYSGIGYIAAAMRTIDSPILPPFS